LSVPRLEAIPDPELRRRAAAFLERYWPHSEIPVDIEHIVDAQLGIEIVPTPQLSALTGAEGFIATDGRRIYMDEQIHQAKTKYTYLFMLAHEVAHLVLHRPLLAAAKYETMTDWKRFHDGLPEEDRQRFEYEAAVFAALILIPSELRAGLAGQAIGKSRCAPRTRGVNVEPKAFVFDDNSEMRSAIAATLEFHGFEVVAFPRGALCSRCRVPTGSACADVLLTDVSMPGVTGLEFVVHQAMVGCGVPLENMGLISATWPRTDRSRIEAFGCRTFSKPYAADELAQWLSDCKARIDPDRILCSAFEKTALSQGVKPVSLNGG